MQAIDFELKDDSYYLFATAELVSREKEFIDDNKLKRLVFSPNVVELSKILRETYYSKYAEQLEEGTGFDRVATQEFEQMASYLSSRLKPQHTETIDLLLIKEQIHNYKVILKALAAGTSLEDLFINIGASYQQLLAAAKTGKGTETGSLEQYMVDKIRQLQQEGQREAELDLEKFFLEELASRVKQMNNRMLTRYLEHSIDMYNIKNIYRHWLTGDKSEIDRILIDEGLLDKKFYLQVKKEGIEGLFKQLEKTFYAPLVTKGSQLLLEHKDYSITEKNEDIFYRIFFDPVKYTVSNLEKIFDFFLRKKIEIKTLNLIYSGVLFDMDKDQIRHEVLILDEDQNRSNW